MPTVPLPDGVSAAQLLRQKAEAGAQRLYGQISPEVRARLDHELEVISRMGFEPVFLIVEEILNFARRSGVPFSSRGSAASSLVAHCLGITSPDPLRLNLYFERFLNPARTTPPDIDTDLCSRRRDEVIQHVFDTYGAERVAMVGTINHFRPRSALGEAAKAHGLAQAAVRELVEQLPYHFFSRPQDQEDEEGSLPPSPFADLRTRYSSISYKRIFEDAEALLKLPRHLSVHPGGVVVAPGRLTDLVPVMRSGSKGVTITQFDLGAVEAFGLVKIDLLGIRGLTVLGDVAEFIHLSRPDQYANPLDVLESTPSEDPETSDRLESGGTIGCFQIESPGMRATLREIRARREDDLIAALALYRPGPLSGGLKDAFVRRFKGQEAISHIHPALAPILEETYGVILYQEQVLRIAHDLAGFSLAEADLLRRAMSHFDPGRQMQMLEKKFVAEAEKRSGVPTETGERVWEMMAAFAGYGFPKAHAASYARVSWRSAWCKTHFPAEFMAAVLANWGGYYSQRVYLSEARRLGLTVRPPHINYSGRNFVVAAPEPGQKALYMGLDQVRDLTGRTIGRILQNRPFQSLEDFLARVDPRRQEAENLARVGAFGGLGSIPSILNRLENGWQAGQPGLFEISGPGEEDWTLERKVAAQQDLLGISPDAHPLELVTKQIASFRSDHDGRSGRAGGRAGDRGWDPPERAPQPDRQGRDDDVPDPGRPGRDAGRGPVPGRLPAGKQLRSLLRAAAGDRHGGEGGRAGGTAAAGRESGEGEGGSGVRISLTEETGRIIDTLVLCGIIPPARPTSSMAEQLPLKQLVRGSSPRSVTEALEERAFFYPAGSPLLPPLSLRDTSPKSFAFAQDYVPHVRSGQRPSHTFGTISLDLGEDT